MVYYLLTLHFIWWPQWSGVVTTPLMLATGRAFGDYARESSRSPIHDIYWAEKGEVGGGAHFIYQFPDSDTKLEGIFLIAHACTHSAYDFWPNQIECPQCIGLSEEVAVVNVALASGFMVVAVSSSDRKSGCWGGEKDVQLVSSVLNYLPATHKELVSLPIISYGCSSGGAFAWRYAQHGRISAVIVQVMSLTIRSNMWAITHPIPVVFNTMSKDKHTTNAMRANAKDLQNFYDEYFHHQNIKKHASDIIVVKDCLSIPVTASYLTNRLFFVNLSYSEAEVIIAVLKIHGFVHNTTNYLVKDPTKISNDWRSALQNTVMSKVVLEKRSIVLTPGRSPLAKALHRCWAFHEYCSDFLIEDIAFIRGYNVSIVL